MSKYHIGENGPAVCRATKRPCPVGGDHFDTPEEAEAAYERELGGAFTKATVSKTRGPLSPESIAKTEFTEEQLSKLKEYDRKALEDLQETGEIDRGDLRYLRTALAETGLDKSVDPGSDARSDEANPSPKKTVESLSKKVEEQESHINSLRDLVDSHEHRYENLERFVRDEQRSRQMIVEDLKKTQDLLDQEVMKNINLREENDRLKQQLGTADSKVSSANRWAPLPSVPEQHGVVNEIPRSDLREMMAPGSRWKQRLISDGVADSPEQSQEVTIEKAGDKQISVVYENGTGGGPIINDCRVLTDYRSGQIWVLRDDEPIMMYEPLDAF